MSVALYIVAGLVGLIVVVIIVQANRKSVYGKAVYQELDRQPDGQQIKFVVQNHPDEELRMNISMMQLEILKRSYKKGIPPSIAAQAMVGAINEILNENGKYN